MHMHVIGDHGRNAKLRFNRLGKLKTFAVKPVHEPPDGQPKAILEMRFQTDQFSAKGVTRHLWRHGDKQQAFAMGDDIGKINLARSLGRAALAKGQ